MKRIILHIFLIMLIVNITLNNYPTLSKKIDDNIYSSKNLINISKNNTFNNDLIFKQNKDFGVWIHSNYNGYSDEIKLDIDLITFKLMIDGGGWKYFRLKLENENDSLVGLQFVRTKIFIEDEEIFVDVVQTQFTFETSCNTNNDYEVSLELRFPYSLLKSKIKSNYFLNFLINRHSIISNFLMNKQKLLNKFNPVLNESYFQVRIGFYSPDKNEGPNRVETRFFFGRNSIFDPRVFRMKINPNNLDREYQLSFFSSYLTTDNYGSETFYRTFSIDFEPAVELQITNIPRNGKISYDFGMSAGSSTKISFKAIGGSLSNIIQSFIIDPLPDYMSFDLTILGERSFKYESEKKYSVKYIMESVDEGNLVSLELYELPEIIKAEWGLNLFIQSLSANGFVDLNMSDDIGRIALSLVHSEKPFIEIENFPQKLKVEGFIDVPNLEGYISASKYLGPTTSINIPIIFDKWEVISTLNIYGGYGHASFNLPDDENDAISFGFDTNNNPLLGIEVIVNDLEINQQVLYLAVGAIATDDFFVSFDYISSEISNFHWSGKITELIDFLVIIDYNGIGFNMKSSWVIGDQGLFNIEINKEISIELNQIEFGDIRLDGIIGVFPGSVIEIGWKRGNIGHIIYQSEGIEFSPEIELNILDKNSNEFFILCNIILNENCIIKFDWDWAESGHFTIFTNNLIEYVNFEIGYNFDENLEEFEYGFKITGSNVNLIRTIQWDSENGVIPRIWVLGDNIPGNWDVWLLWKYEWYEVK